MLPTGIPCLVTAMERGADLGIERREKNVYIKSEVAATVTFNTKNVHHQSNPKDRKGKQPKQP